MSLLTWWRTRQERWAVAFAFEHAPRLTAYRELLKQTASAPKTETRPASTYLNLTLVRGSRRGRAA